MKARQGLREGADLKAMVEGDGVKKQNSGLNSGLQAGLSQGLNMWLKYIE